MYGVLYAISPELFPAKDRGTGNGLTATATRVFGILVSHPLVYASLVDLVMIGPRHCALREFGHCRTGLCFRSIDIRSSAACVVAAL